MREQEGGCDFVKAAYVGDFLNRTAHKVWQEERLGGGAGASTLYSGEAGGSDMMVASEVMRGMGLDSVQFVRGGKDQECSAATAFPFFDLRLSWNASMQKLAAIAIDTVLHGRVNTTDEKVLALVELNRARIESIVGTSLPYAQHDAGSSTGCFQKDSDTAFCSGAAVANATNRTYEYCPCVPVLGKLFREGDAATRDAAQQRQYKARCENDNQCFFAPPTAENSYTWGLRVISPDIGGAPPCDASSLKEDASLTNRTSSWNPKKLTDCYCFSKLDRLVKADGLGSGLLSFLKQDSDVCSSNM